MREFRPTDRQLLIMCGLLADRWRMFDKAAAGSAYVDELWDLLCELTTELSEARGIGEAAAVDEIRREML